jgi:hypothetical protein
VELDQVGNYVVFLSRVFHHGYGYYRIHSNKTYYTTQLFCMSVLDNVNAWQNVTRKVNTTILEGHVEESSVKELTQYLQNSWDTMYSVNLFRPAKKFGGETIDATKNRHILRAIVNKL